MMSSVCRGKKHQIEEGSILKKIGYKDMKTCKREPLAVPLGLKKDQCLGLYMYLNVVF